MKECILCKRNMFLEKGNIGQGCIKNIYSFLSFKMPKKLKLRENELYGNIMKATNKKNLNKEHKLILVDRYLTLKYLESMKYGDFDKLKDEIKNDIDIINNNVDVNTLSTIEKVTLKSVYNSYKNQEKFDENIVKLRGAKTLQAIQVLIPSFNFIFNFSNNKSQYEKDNFKMLQYAFWQIVIEVGRVKFGYKYAADFLQHSLEKSPKNLLITDGDIVDKIKNNKNFKTTIENIVAKYGKNQDSFQFDSNIDNDEKLSLILEDGDLYYAINKAKLMVNGIKVDTNWKLNIKISDTYDYSEFKILEYYKVKNIVRSLFSSTIYNLARVSSNFGAIKEYDIDIEFNYAF